jgi:hypothetical protein
MKRAKRTTNAHALAGFGMGGRPGGRGRGGRFNRSYNRGMYVPYQQYGSQGGLAGGAWGGQGGAGGAGFGGRGAGGGRGAPGGLDGDQCNYCFQKGHWKNECRQKKLDEANGQQMRS